jgi:hypothetical protein
VSHDEPYSCSPPQKPHLLCILGAQQTPIVVGGQSQSADVSTTLGWPMIRIDFIRMSAFCVAVRWGSAMWTE